MLGERDQPLILDQFYLYPKADMVSCKLEPEMIITKVIKKALIPLQILSRQPILQLNKEDKMPLMLKKMPMPGEPDGLQVLDHFYLYTKEELFQTDTLSTTIILKPQSKTLTMPLKLLDQLLLVLKRPLMLGEKDQLQTQDQFFL